MRGVRTGVQNAFTTESKRTEGVSPPGTPLHTWQTVPLHVLIKQHRCCPPPTRGPLDKSLPHRLIKQSDRLELDQGCQFRHWLRALQHGVEKKHKKLGRTVSVLAL